MPFQCLHSLWDETMGVVSYRHSKQNFLVSKYDFVNFCFRLQRERAERERQGGPLVDVHPRSPSRGVSSTCIGPNNR